MEKVNENGRKVKTFLLFFASFSNIEKSAKNGRKVKIALLFCCFLPLYGKWKKSLKMDEKLRL